MCSCKTVQCDFEILKSFQLIGKPLQQRAVGSFSWSTEFTAGAQKRFLGNMFFLLGAIQDIKSPFERHSEKHMVIDVDVFLAPEIFAFRTPTHDLRDDHHSNALE